MAAFKKNEFNAMLARKLMSRQDLAVYLGVNPASVYRRIQQGGNFNYEQLSKMVELFGISDVCKAFFNAD